MLFCLTTTYTQKALDAMAKNPNANRREAVEKLITAAGGKLVAMCGTIADGPGAMVIFDVDSIAAPAMAGVAAATEGLANVKLQRLISGDEVSAVRQKRIELQKLTDRLVNNW
jgi:GYD domain